MRTSRYLLSTLKETPNDAELISHQLMLRAGMIRKLASGLYTWLPTGLRVLNRVARIVRDEMDRAGAIEILMPGVQPAELWQETGRWGQFGPELLRLKDRHDRAFCLGPTHEEVVTDLLRNELRSYKQLPINLYQVQTKFRDETRPRFGVMRAREFIMKDAYSFHLDDASLQQTYDAMYQAYSRIFERLGLQFRAVLADTGSIGGNHSHEFHVLAASGEDAIAYSPQSGYAANVEKAEALSLTPRAEPSQPLQQVATPHQRSIAEVSAALGLPAERLLKTLIVEGQQGLVALLLRGDHELNEVKAEKLPQLRQPLQLASDARLQEFGLVSGFIGPVGLSIPIIADRAASQLADFACGANQPGQHLIGVNWQRDLPEAETADLRNVVDGDPSPDGQGSLELCRGIEVGHIFQLGRKYSEAMQAKVLNEQGQTQTVTMGCYGIGVSRIVAAAIEQNYDQNGIIWADSIAPFQIALIPMNYHKSETVRQQADALYQQLVDAGFDVLLDDRNERPGVMFADSELIGIPHRLVVGDKGLARGVIEYKHRRGNEPEELALSGLLEQLNARVQR